VEPASLKQLCKLALVPGEARDRLGLFIDALHPREANKATHGIGTEYGFPEPHTAVSQRLAFRRNTYRPEAKRVASSP